MELQTGEYFINFAESVWPERHKKKHKIRQTVNLRVKSRKFHSRRFQKKGEEKGYEGHRSGLCK